MKYIWQSSTWPKLTWDSEALLGPLSQARRAQGQLLEKFSALGFEVSPRAQAELLISEAVQTSAIEGEKLDPAAVRSSVARKLGLPVQGLLLHPPRQVDGLVEVLLDAVTNFQTPLTSKRLQSWQAALFPTGYSGFKKIRVGKWRTKKEDPMQVLSGPFGREKVHYEAPPAKHISKDMKDFLKWWRDSQALDGVLRAGIAHFKFVTIHPFEDGNGRVARALTDMALAQDEKSKVRFYSLSTQIMKEREDYYLVLQKTQALETDITPWLKWFLECFLRAIENSMVLLSGVLAKAEFWRKHAEVPVSERQRKVLNRLLDAGKGNFQGGLTTRKYVALTKTSRATAFREIQDLLDKKLIVQNEAKGRSVSYDLELK